MNRIYYGWWVVAACLGIVALTVGATFMSFGLYVDPVSKVFGLSRADMNTGLVVLNLGNAIQAPFLGRVLDRAPARRVMILAAIGFGLSLSVLSVSNSVWINMAVLALLLPFSMEGAGTLTAPVLVSRWFTTLRARAMLIAQLGPSAGMMFMPVVTGLLIQAYGWRSALLISGVAIAAVVLLVALVLRVQPGPQDSHEATPLAAPTQDAPAAPGIPLLKVLGDPGFWTITVSSAMVTAMAMSLLISIAPFGLSRGLTVTQSAGLMSLWAMFGIAGQFGLSLIADRFDKATLMSVVFLLTITALLALLLGHSYTALMVGAALGGLLYTGSSPMFFALLVDRFGAGSAGGVMGTAIPIVAAASVLSARFAGEVFDRTGSYDYLFITYIGLHVMAAALLLATRFVRAPRAA